jgi:hypothetical protein
MRIEQPKLAVYGCTYERAMDIVCDRGLRHCEPQPQPVSGYQFASESDLTLFGLMFAGEVEFEDPLAIVLPAQVDQVEEFLSHYGLKHRVKRFDLLPVLFWHTGDEQEFREEIGFRL